MHMEAVHCGYPVGSNSLGGLQLMTPPSTPTDIPQDSCSRLDCDDGLMYNRLEYSKTEYSSSPLLPTPEERLSPLSCSPVSPDLSPSPSPAQSPAAQTRGRRTGITSPPIHQKDTNRSRKSSFVYDVRLTDEQFLFFVPDLDLVKSHLMFAVREEVEVLKEKIGELMEKITQLEFENTVLKQYATPETLQQIQQHHSSNT